MSLARLYQLVAKRHNTASAFVQGAGEGDVCTKQITNKQMVDAGDRCTIGAVNKVRVRASESA